MPERFHKHMYRRTVRDDGVTDIRCLFCVDYALVGVVTYFDVLGFPIYRRISDTSEMKLFGVHYRRVDSVRVLEVFGIGVFHQIDKRWGLFGVCINA